VRPWTIDDRVIRCSTPNHVSFPAFVSLSQCYCGSKWTSGTQAATEGSCNMVRSLISSLLRPVSDVVIPLQPCAGKVSQTCGGSNRLSVYAKSSSSSTTSVSASAPTASGTAAPLPSGWQLQGCTSAIDALLCQTFCFEADQLTADFDCSSCYRCRRWLGTPPDRIVHKPQDDQHAGNVHRSLRCRRLQLRRHSEWRPCVDPSCPHSSLDATPAD
jgi:hypothetical protein